MGPEAIVLIKKGATSHRFLLSLEEYHTSFSDRRFGDDYRGRTRSHSQGVLP